MIAGWAFAYVGKAATGSFSGKSAAELEQLKNTIANKEREATAMSIASTMASEKPRFELLKKEALQFINYTPDGVKINGADGAALTAEQLKQHLTHGSDSQCEISESVQYK